MKRPNILFAIADDASHMSCYGTSLVSTPNCDYVASEGIKFNNAFTTNPKCAPSRASILTGRYTWELEEACNHYSIFSNKFKVFPDILESNGYKVGFTGKGWAPGSYEKGGFTRNPAGTEYNSFHLTPPEDSLISSCDYLENFNQFLKEKDDDQPFCFWYGCREPHRPYRFGEGCDAGKKISDINYIPSYWPQTKDIQMDMLDYAYEVEWFDSQLGKLIGKLKEIGEFENTLIIVTSDNGMPFPRIKGQMYEQDFHLPMVACWKGKIISEREVDDLINFIDIAPTFLQVAGIEIPNNMTGKSFYDILLSEKNGQIDEDRSITYFGRENHDLGSENDVGYPVRCIRNKKYMYCRNFASDRYPAGNPETYYTNCDDSPTKSAIVDLNYQGNSKCFDLCFGKRPTEELYDIEKDVECVENLAYNQDFKEIKDSLWEQLQKKLLETGDPRILGNGDIFDTYEYIGFETCPHSWANYIKKTPEAVEYYESHNKYTRR